MNEREPISKKLRFEVFKRDKFTCRYCGAKSPDVLLEVDHIHPVADGGTNDLLNLTTACKGCNSGKGARRLDDTTVVDRQHDQLAELEERRQQIEMMLSWRDELQEFAGNSIKLVEDRIEQRTGFTLNDSGRATIRRWLKRFSVNEVVRAADEAFDTYLQYRDGVMTSESWERAFSKIPGVIDILRQEEEKPYLRRLLYIQGIIRKRGRAPRYRCSEYLEHVHLAGMSIEELERRAKSMTSLEDFEAPIDAWLEEIGDPY